MTVLPDDYFDSYIVNNSDGYWGSLSSKADYSDTSMHARSYTVEVLKLADALRAGHVDFTITDSADREWAITTLDELRTWLADRDRSSTVIDLPRTDPYVLSADDGFTVTMRSQLLNGRDGYIYTQPLLAALQELQQGSPSIEISNLVTAARRTAANQEQFFAWVSELDPQIERVFRERSSDTEAYHRGCPCSRCRSTT